jgi:hypothetical protein
MGRSNTKKIFKNCSEFSKSCKILAVLKISFYELKDQMCAHLS